MSARRALLVVPVSGGGGMVRAGRSRAGGGGRGGRPAALVWFHGWGQRGCARGGVCPRGGVRKRRRLWVPAAIVVSVACLAVIVAAVIWSHVNSVPMKFVNDTGRSVVLPDCGPDLERLGAGQAAVISVDKRARYCSIDGTRGSGEAVVGCLILPSPLGGNAVVRLSDARPVSRSHPCG
jgi:hypothetical protein